MLFFKKYWLTITGIALGAIAGYFYWHQVGCVSGNCPITSRPLNASLYGALMGGLIFSMFNPTKIKHHQNDNNN